MKWILLDDTLRKRIIKKVQPQKNDFFSYQNLNLLTGVLDEESGVILTKTYALSEGLKRCGNDFDDAAYIILTEHLSFLLTCGEYFSGEHFRNIKSPCPTAISDSRLLEMLNFYFDNFRDGYKLKKQAFERGEFSGFKSYNFPEQYLEKYYFGEKE